MPTSNQINWRVFHIVFPQISSPNTFSSRHWPGICFPPGLNLDLAACPASGGNGGFTWIHRAQMGGIWGDLPTGGGDNMG